MESKPDQNKDRSVTIYSGKLRSEDLFKKTKELVIRHKDNDYKLRLTANDKLILTK